MIPSFFMVYGDGRGAPTMKHASKAEAQREAERLARNYPGIKFFVLCAISVSSRVDVVTEELDDIPF